MDEQIPPSGAEPDQAAEASEVADAVRAAMLGDIPDPARSMDVPGARRRAERSLAVSEAALVRYARATHRKSRWRIGTALFAKAAALVDLGRFDEGIAACDELVSHYGHAADTPTQVLTAAALRYRRKALKELGETRALIWTCDEVVRRFGAATDPVLRQEVAAAISERCAAGGGGHEPGVLGQPSPPGEG